MAADHWRMWLDRTNIPDCGSSEQYAAKTKKLEWPGNNLSAKSHISLQWECNQSKVVARIKQIGISRRYLGYLLIDSAPKSCNVLADIFAVPQEIFELNNLSEYPPRGQNAEEVVQSLLDGPNYYFGNPLLKWGASFCSGKLQNDEVPSREQYLKAANKTYKTTNYLQKLKNMYESNEDPAVEVLQRKW